MLYILFGEDSFSLQEALEDIKGGLGNGELLASNTTTLDGQQVTLNQLMAACNTVPFLAQKRLVIVQGLLTHFEQRSRSLAPELRKEEKNWQTLKDYIARIPASTVLVLVDSRLRRDNHLLRDLAPKAKVRQFPALRGTSLHQWTRARVKKSGGNISPSAIQLLADLIGGNLWFMASEIEKLSLYTQERPIEEKDVRLMVNYALESNVFAMVDAIMQGRTSVAARALHQLLEEGLAAPYLLFMTTRQFRMLVQGKELSSSGLPLKEIATKLGLTSEYALTRTMEQARGYSMKHLEEVYHKLLDTDLSIKTGKQRGELALDLLVTELCQKVSPS